MYRNGPFLLAQNIFSAQNLQKRPIQHPAYKELIGFFFIE